ncbi:hypothetical protein D9M69_469310 [compost metagenome]
MQAQQAHERDDHVDVAVVAADHLARQAQPRDHDQRHQRQQHPRRPLAAAREFGLQAHALAELAGAFNDAGGAVGCARGRGAKGRRVVERAVLFGPSDRLGDHRIRKSRCAQRGGGDQQGPFFFANDAPAQQSGGGARKLCPAHAEGLPKRNGAANGPVALRLRIQRRPKNDSTATTTTTRPTM